MFLTLQGFTLNQLFFYFIIYSVMGWIMETILCSYNEKKFVNRGYLSGPYCPIYGVGMCLIILTLSSYQDRLTDLFLGGILVASTLEYFTGWLMEKLFHTKWWDYSDKKFNLHGRICLQISLAWGVLSLVIIKVVQPFVNQFVNWFPVNIGKVILIVFGIIFIADAIHATIIAAHLSKKIHLINQIKADLHNLSLKLNPHPQEKLKNLTINQLFANVASYLNTKKIENRENFQKRIAELKANYRHTQHKSIFERRLQKAFPSMKSIPRKKRTNKTTKK